MQAFQWDAHNHPQVHMQAPYTFHTLDFSCMQNLKPCNEESKDSNYNSKIDAFAEELDCNWYNLNTYD